MKKYFKHYLVVMFIIGGVISPSTHTDAATKEIKYSTCKELNAVYKNGVKKSTDTKNAVKNQKTKVVTYKASNAYVSASLYNLNMHLDADKDGIACEK